VGSLYVSTHSVTITVIGGTMAMMLALAVLIGQR
jgi:hypothetical protein